MDELGELYMSAAAVLVDAADTEAEVALVGHAVSHDLHRGVYVRGHTLLPLLGTHLLSLQHVDGACGGLGGSGGRRPGQESTVGTVHVHLGCHRTGGGAVFGSLRGRRGGVEDKGKWQEEGIQE